MRVFEIIDHEYEADIELEDEAKCPPFGVIRFSLQFIGFLLKADVIVTEKTISFSDYDFGFVGDSLDRNFSFDNKTDYDDFLHAILEASQEIAGKTLMWENWRNGYDDDESENETIGVPPPPNNLKLFVG